MNKFKWIKLFLIYLLAFVLQTTVGDWLQIFGVGPDFIVIFIVAIAIKYGPATGCFWGFLAGFAQDMYAPVEWLGAHSIAMTVLGFVVGQLEERFLTLNLPAKMAVLAIGFFVDHPGMCLYGGRRGCRVLFVGRESREEETRCIN